MTEIYNEVQKAIEILFPEGVTTEVRVPKSRKYGTISGYFDNRAKMSTEISELSGHAGVYYVMNPVNPALLARAFNVIQTHADLTTTDDQIVKRNWLLIDFDAKRPAGISSSNLEKELAFDTMVEVFEWLKEQGWPAPVSADSGNGYHLLYRIDLDNTKESTELVKNVLRALAEKFDNERVNVDRSVFNASRITKAYGTWARKGQDTPDRPHRQSQLRKVPLTITPVTFEQLSKVAALAPSGLIVKVPKLTSSKQDTPITAEKIEEFLDFYDLDHSGAETRHNGLRWKLTVCPFNSEHSHGEVAVFLNNDGGLGFQCFHSSCQDNHWKQFRAFLEEKSEKKFWFRDNVPDVIAPSAKTTASLKIVRGDQVKPEKIEWLWEGKVALGKLTLFVGHPGIGKGLCTMDIAARVTTGSPWADGLNNNVAADVLISSSEDAVSDTLIPRLMAAGANVSRCSFIESTVDAVGERVFSLDTDLPQLQAHLEQNPNIRLVIIDPIANHLGALNANREQEVRKILTPLGALAAKYKIAVIIVSHFNKKTEAEVVQRVGGAMAMIGCVRVAWAFTQSKDDENLRVMHPIKANVTKTDEGLKYDIDVAEVEIGSSLVEIAKIFWCGNSTETPAASLAYSKNQNKKGVDDKPLSESTDTALIWVTDFLADGQPHPRKDVVDAAAMEKIASSTTIDRAWKKLPDGAKNLNAPFGMWQLFAPKAIPVEAQ